MDHARDREPGNSDNPNIKICDLYFTHPPRKPGTYPVTVTLVTDEGVVFEASCEVVFPDPSTRPAPRADPSVAPDPHIASRPA